MPGLEIHLTKGVLSVFEVLWKKTPEQNDLNPSHTFDSLVHTHTLVCV